ncbi:MAG: FAD binding domain-containing protein [Bacteroidetes bacterium]|nr:FAD binding domain-containing protein [Bacteroidota bacterium]
MIKEQLYFKAKSIEEAIIEANNHIANFRYIAGGTDVLVNKFQGNENSKMLIDLSGIDSLKQITIKGNQVEIGALIILDELKNHKIIAESFPALFEAAHAVASPMIRKTATIGGNLLCENRCTFYNQTEWWRKAAGYCLKCDGDICIATGGKNNCLSKFISDTAVVLISMNASIEIFDNNQTSIIPLESIYTGDGVNPRNLSNSAIIKSIFISNDEGFTSVYKKLRQRETLEFGSLITAVTKSKNGKIKIVLGGVDPKPIVVEGIANDDLNELIIIASKKARTVDNDMYSRKYRKEMISVYLKRSFQELGLILP